MTAPAGLPWQPRYIRRFIQHFDTGAGVIRVETDHGEGYAKVLGNPTGPHALAREWVCTSLARWLGLPTFHFAKVDVLTENDLPLARGGVAQSGPAFITRAERGINWGGSDDELQKLDNPEAITLLVLCDTWLRNRDRWPGLASGHPNRDNVFFSEENAARGHFLLKAMDFSHCLDRGDLSPRLSRIDCVKDVEVYGRFPEFEPFLRRETMQEGITRLATLQVAFVRGIIAEIPREWEVDGETREAMLRLICQRAAFVADTLLQRFWPQMTLAFPDDTQRG